MKHTFKRGLSWLLVLAMCVSLLSGITLTASAATVNYVYSGNYIYNWGKRGETATFLSPNAESFYSDNNVTYAELATYSGSSSTSSVPSSELFTELHSLMYDNWDDPTSYDGTKTLYQYTDCENSGNPKTISSFYSGTAIGPSWNNSWNREHTWPNSKSNSGSDSKTTRENDIMMLRPTSTTENSSRGNTAYGESSGYYHPNSESEGAYDLRGDVARIVLYVYVCFGTSTNHDGCLDYMWGSKGVMESKEVLLKWMEEDPVDTWELGRNDSVESITGTRNVFVDYPELAFALFNEEVPAGYQTPSGEGNAASYNITATSSNTSYGTVSLSGNTITATPKTGYYVTGYTVTSGTATVTQSGNTFKVSASSDCTVRINFAAKTAVTLTFMEDGAIGSTISSYGGDSVTLPSNKNFLADGYSFVGWVESAVDETAEKPGTVYAAGSTVTAVNKTYYALYSRVDSESTDTVGEYTLYSGAVSEGDYIIVYDGAAMKATDTDSNTRIDSTSVTISNNTISQPDDSVVWHIATSGSYYTIYNESAGVYAAGLSSDNKATLLSSATNYANWTVTGSTVFEFQNAGNNRYLRLNGSVGFGCYSTSTGGALSLYKGASGTTYYTTNTITCAHEDTTNVAAVKPTCTESGYTAGLYCNDCDRYISGHEVVEATGHSYGAWKQTTAPTCTAAGVETQTCTACGDEQTQSVAATGHSYETVVTPPTTYDQGFTTYTCDTCGDSYVSDYVEALGEVFTVSFKVPLGVDAIANMQCGKDGISLPSAGVPAGEQTYSFVGWSAETIEDTDTAPTVYKAGEIYTATANTTLRAVYSYVVGGTGETGYVLKDISEITATDVVVITMTYTDGTVYALPNNIASSPEAMIVTVNNNKLVNEPTETLLWNIGGNSSGYTFSPNGSSTYLYCTSTNDGVKIGTSSANKFILDGTSGYLKHTGTNRYLGVYRTNPDWRCYTNTTGNTANQTLGFYVKASGTTYYTTEIGAEPAVAVYIGGALEAECATFEDALAYLGDSGLYLKLLQDVEAEAILEDVLYLDLNGHSISGILEPDVYSITVFDSSTDSYNGDNVGYFSCTDIDDNPIVPARHIKTDVTGSIKRYMTIETENGYTFHRFYMGITHATVKPGAVGVGYKAVFAGDDAVKAQIGSYGIKLWVEGNEAYTATLSLNNGDFVSGKAVTVRVDNIDVENYGETPLNAHVFMTLTDGTQVEVEQPTATISMTLQQMVENVNTNYTAYTTAQLAALREMLDKFSITAGWKTENIK